MTDAPTAYPLAWPEHRARTPSHRRRNGVFKQGGGYIGVAAAADRIDHECGRLGAQYPLISSNVPRRANGAMGTETRGVDDPGVVVFFHLKGKPFALACDTYTNVAQNIAAVAAHLEATRAIERYGVATAAESLQAFSALPPPSNAKPKRPWWVVFGVERSAVDAGDIEALYKVRARKAHPDTGGSTEAMAELNDARQQALAEVPKDGR